ncbi:MAG: hypothetical protein PHP45_07385 [Elusimicrobiales bacterium]|nr:hypothetical protein [Elusimicrobiales bacterium]
MKMIMFAVSAGMLLASGAKTAFAKNAVQNPAVVINQWQDVEEIDAPYNACMESAKSSSAAKAACAAKAEEIWKKEFNVVTNYRLDALPSDQEDQLIKAQEEWHAWFNDKVKHMKAVCSERGAGSDCKAAMAIEKTRIIRARALELRNMRFPDGTREAKADGNYKNKILPVIVFDGREGVAASPAAAVK